MDTLFVIFPVLLGSGAISGLELMRRYTTTTCKLSPLQALWLQFGNATIIFGILYLSIWGFTMPTVLDGFWRPVLGNYAIGILIQWCRMKAASLDKGEVSQTAPLQATTPFLLPFTALALHEVPGTAGWIGIWLMASGTFILLFERTPHGFYEYVGPIRRIAIIRKIREGSKEEINKAWVVLFSLASAILAVPGIITDALYVRRALELQGLILGSVTITFLLAMTFYAWYKTHPDTKTFPTINEKLVFGTLGISTFWVLSVLLIWPSYGKHLVAYVGTLRRLSVLVSIICAHWFFGEGEFKKRLTAGVLVVLGIVFISFDNLPSRIETKITGWGF